MLVIFSMNSQPASWRVSRPDLDLAYIVGWAACGLATAHKHFLCSKCYFYAVC